MKILVINSGSSSIKFQLIEIDSRTSLGRGIVDRIGLKDGLFWPVSEGQHPSPLGPMVADAAAEGYKRPGGTPAPYHGYFYKVLKAQGPDAPGGAFSYVVNDNMVAGYALLAWPAEYGNAGIKTFVVNQQGLVFEKDLGPDTEKVAAGITEYDPDDSWRPVEDTDIEGPEATSSS